MRSLHSEGFLVGRWLSRKFNGRFFSISCKANSTGRYVKFEIYGARKSLKTLIILVGINLAGLILFVDTLARTTAGPDRRSQVYVHQPRVASTGVPPKWAVGDGSFAAVVAASEGPAAAVTVGDSRGEDQEHCWRVVMGLSPSCWSFDTLVQIKLVVPGV